MSIYFQANTHNKQTESFLQACGERNLNEILAGLNDKNVNICAEHSRALMNICLTQEHSENSLYVILQRVLSHHRVQKNTQFWFPKNVNNIVGLYKGEYTDKGLVAPAANKDKIIDLLVKIGAGKFKGGASGVAALEDSFFEKHKSKAITFIGGVALLGAVYGAYLYTDTLKVNQTTQNSILTPKTNYGPENLYVPLNVSKPHNQQNISGDFTGGGLLNFNRQVESVLNKMAENPIYWTALHSLYSKGSVNVEILTENTPESHALTFTPMNDATIRLDNIDGAAFRVSDSGEAFFSDYSSDFNEPEWVKFNVISQVMSKYAMNSSPQLLKATETNNVNKANAEMISWAYGDAMALLELAKTGELANTLYLDRFDAMRPAIEKVLEAHNAGKSDVEILQTGMVYSFYSGLDIKKTHESTDGLINSIELSRADGLRISNLQGLYLSNTLKTTPTLADKELRSLFAKDVQKNIEFVNSQCLTGNTVNPFERIRFTNDAVKRSRNGVDALILSAVNKDAIRVKMDTKSFNQHLEHILKQSGIKFNKAIENAKSLLLINKNGKAY